MNPEIERSRNEYAKRDKTIKQKIDNRFLELNYNNQTVLFENRFLKTQKWHL